MLNKKYTIFPAKTHLHFIVIKSVDILTTLSYGIILHVYPCNVFSFAKPCHLFFGKMPDLHEQLVVKAVVTRKFSSQIHQYISVFKSEPVQKIVRGTLKTIVQDIEGKNIDRTAMIVVSRCLGADYELSRLYAPEFSHMFREASK